MEKKGLVFKVNAFDMVAVKSLHYGENTWHRQSLGKQKVLRFQIGLIGTFSSFMCVRMRKKLG